MMQERKNKYGEFEYGGAHANLGQRVFGWMGSVASRLFGTG